MSYKVNTILASRCAEYSDKSLTGLFALARQVIGHMSPTVEIRSDVLNQAIKDLFSIGSPVTSSLATQLAQVR